MEAPENDDLLPRLVHGLIDPQRRMADNERLDLLTEMLMIFAFEQRWHYLALLCAIDLYRTDRALPPISQIASDDIAALLVLNNRINEALHLRLNPAMSNDPGRVIDPRMPARFFNLPRTDRWVTSDDVRAIFADLRARALRLPERYRAPWLERVLVRRLRRFDNRLKDAALMQLMRHAMAQSGLRWRRHSKLSRDDAVHVRIGYATAFIVATVRVGDRLKRRRRLLAAIGFNSLSDAERPFSDSHIGARSVSGWVYHTLLALREGRRDESLRLLRDLYDLLLRPLLDDPDIAGRIAARGPHPVLVVATQGALAQLPFAALHDGSRYLAERFDIVQASPIHSTRPFVPADMDDDSIIGGTAPSAPRSLRVLADTSLSGALPAVRSEIDAYRGLAAQGVVDLELLGDGVADWEGETLERLLARPGTALLSAHISADGVGAEGLAIRTPGGRALPIAAAMPRSVGAELIVLSGCASVGQSDWLTREDSLVSLLRRRGARATIATLWPINDKAATLYNIALVSALASGASRARAHGEAQRCVMRSLASASELGPAERGIAYASRLGPTAAATEVKLDHPYFWAPFILSGAWR